MLVFDHNFEYEFQFTNFGQLRKVNCNLMATFSSGPSCKWLQKPSRFTACRQRSDQSDRSQRASFRLERTTQKRKKLRISYFSEPLRYSNWTLHSTGGVPRKPHGLESPMWLAPFARGGVTKRRSRRRMNGTLHFRLCFVYKSSPSHSKFSHLLLWFDKFSA